MATVTGSPPPSDQQPPAPEDAGVAGSVTGQWAEVYPPDTGEPEPAEKPTVSPLAAVATVLFGAAAILIVASSFMPLFQASLASGPGTPGLTTTVSMDAWHLTSGDQLPNSTLSSRVSPAPVPVGYPLVAAALLATVVTVLRLRPAGERLANALGIAAAAFATGLVFALGMFEAAWRGLSSSAAVGPVDATIGPGYWLLVTASVVSIVAAIAAYRRSAEPSADADESDDSVGMTIVYPPAEPNAEVPPGQPAEWPVVAVIPNDERTNW
jgi:hypothetical protein